MDILRKGCKKISTFPPLAVKLKLKHTEFPPSLLAKCDAYTDVHVLKRI